MLLFCLLTVDRQVAINLRSLFDSQSNGPVFCSTLCCSNVLRMDKNDENGMPKIAQNEVRTLWIRSQLPGLEVKGYVRGS